VQWLSRHEAGLYDATGRGWPDLAGAGWALCNGQNGTADLRERFVAGLGSGGDYNAVGKTGGAARVALTVPQLPPHAHTMQTAGEHTHTYPDRYTVERNAIDSGDDRRRDQDTTETKTTSAAGNHQHVINETGDGQAHENRPPFYVLVAREWVGL
jgi:microcystin-dependent protein